MSIMNEENTIYNLVDESTMELKKFGFSFEIEQVEAVKAVFGDELKLVLKKNRVLGSVDLSSQTSLLTELKSEVELKANPIECKINVLSPFNKQQLDAKLMVELIITDDNLLQLQCNEIMIDNHEYNLKDTGIGIEIDFVDRCIEHLSNMGVVERELNVLHVGITEGKLTEDGIQLDDPMVVGTLGKWLPSSRARVINLLADKTKQLNVPCRYSGQSVIWMNVELSVVGEDDSPIVVFNSLTHNW